MNSIFIWSDIRPLFYHFNWWNCQSTKCIWVICIIYQHKILFTVLRGSYFDLALYPIFFSNRCRVKSSWEIFQFQPFTTSSVIHYDDAKIVCWKYYCEKVIAIGTILTKHLLSLQSVLNFYYTYMDVKNVFNKILIN